MKKQSKLVKFHETRKVPEPVLTALSQISFDYYCSHPEHETDITSPIYRHLLGDMKEILCDLNSVLAFQEVYPGQIPHAHAVSDKIYQSFISHWGTNHCLDLIYAIQNHLVKLDA